MARSLVPFVFEAGYPPGRGGDPFLQLHREMNRLFDDALRGGGSAGGGGGTMAGPRMNVSETASEIRVEAELPGVSEKDVHVELADDLLTIRGEKRAERENRDFHVVERSFGTFQRSVRLPFAATPESVQASFKDGVLTVTLPKSAAKGRVHRIQVQARGAEGGTGTAGGAAMPAETAGHATPDTTHASGMQGGPVQGRETPNPGHPT